MNDLLTFARDIAAKSAHTAMSYYGNAAVTEKADKTFVTEADQRIHDFLIQELSHTGIPVLSEEGELVLLPYPERLWIIDPIDGTSGFIRRTGEFSVMIGLLQEGKPILGVVHNPATDIQYYASKGEGAWIHQNGTASRLIVSNRTHPTIRAIGSGAHAAPYMKEVADLLHVVEDVRMGGLGVKAGIVAEGKAEYFLTLGALGEWDVCAPHIIVEEAGGRVSDRYGNDLRYGNPEARFQSGVIFSNGTCHHLVTQTLAQALS